MTERSLQWGAALVAVGALLSGPLGVAVVWLVAPQPAWQDVDTFASHYHVIQAVPYALGFVLLAGFVLFVSAAAARVPRRAAAASATLAIGGTLAATNYILQLVFVPAKLDSPFVAVVAMSNPTAATWGAEMFAYAFLGIAMWLVAPAVPRSATLLAINAVARLLLI